MCFINYYRYYIYTFCLQFFLIKTKISSCVISEVRHHNIVILYERWILICYRQKQSTCEGSLTPQVLLKS